MESTEFKAWRERLGYSQTTAADLLGVKVSTIEKYETDNWYRFTSKIPKHIELATITLEVVSYLIEETRQEIAASHKHRRLQGLFSLSGKLRSDGGLINFLKTRYVRKSAVF